MALLIALIWACVAALAAALAALLAAMLAVKASILLPRALTSSLLCFASTKPQIAIPATAAPPMTASHAPVFIAIWTPLASRLTLTSVFFVEFDLAAGSHQNLGITFLVRADLVAGEQRSLLRDSHALSQTSSSTPTQLPSIFENPSSAW